MRGAEPPNKYEYCTRTGTSNPNPAQTSALGAGAPPRPGRARLLFFFSFERDDGARTRAETVADYGTRMGRAYSTYSISNRKLSSYRVARGLQRPFASPRIMCTAPAFLSLATFRFPGCVRSRSVHVRVLYEYSYVCVLCCGPESPPDHRLLLAAACSCLQLSLCLSVPGLSLPLSLSRPLTPSVTINSRSPQNIGAFVKPRVTS